LSPNEAQTPGIYQLYQLVLDADQPVVQAIQLNDDSSALMKSSQGDNSSTSTSWWTVLLEFSAIGLIGYGIYLFVTKKKTEKLGGDYHKVKPNQAEEALL